MQTTRVSIGGSGVLQDDAFDDVGHVLAAVRGRLQLLVDVLPLDDVDRVLAVLEERRERVLLDPVSLVFLGMDLDAVLEKGARQLHAAHLGQQHGDDLRGVDQHPRQRLGVVGGLVDLVEVHPRDGRVDQVDDVVDPADQLVDVLAVERGDEGLVQLLDRGVGELVPGVLDVLDPLHLLGDVPEVLEQVDERQRPLVGVPGRLLKEVEENRFLGEQAEHEARIRSEVPDQCQRTAKTLTES